MKVIDVGADLDDLSDKLVADRHRNRDGRLRPSVPFVNVNVGAADPRVSDADQHVIDAYVGSGISSSHSPGAGWLFTRAFNAYPA